MYRQLSFQIFKGPLVIYIQNITKVVYDYNKTNIYVYASRENPIIGKKSHSKVMAGLQLIMYS